MQDTGWLWAVFTVIAAASQTARNAMQRELTATLGTVGATHVRFLFGFPFALLFLAGLLLVTGATLPTPPLVVLAVDRARRRHADRRHRADAGGDGRALLRRHHRLYQDRAGAGRAVRPDLSRRRAFDRHGRGDPDRDRGRHRDVAQARRRGIGQLAADHSRPERRRDVRALGDRLSRRDPEPRISEFRRRGDASRSRSGSCCRLRRCRSGSRCASRK